jgi:hypothetical protein
MPTIDKVKNIKHGHFIVELAPGSSLHKEITAPMVGAGGGIEMEGANLAIGFAYLTRPFVMIDNAHKHPFDQFLMFFSAPPRMILPNSTLK